MSLRPRRCKSPSTHPFSCEVLLDRLARRSRSVVSPAAGKQRIGSVLGEPSPLVTNVQVQQQVLFLHAHVLRDRHHLQPCAPQFRQVGCVKPSPVPFSSHTSPRPGVSQPQSSCIRESPWRSSGLRAARSIEHDVASTPAERAAPFSVWRGGICSVRHQACGWRVCCRLSARMMDLLSRRPVLACGVGGGRPAAWAAVLGSPVVARGGTRAMAASGTGGGLDEHGWAEEHEQRVFG